MNNTTNSYVEKLHINEANCNPTLTQLYIKRDNIGNNISKAEAYDLDATRLYNDYNEIVDCIEEICRWRSTHNCALEGDDWAEPSVV